MAVIVDATVIRRREIPNKNIEFQILDPVSQFPDMKDIWPGSNRDERVRRHLTLPKRLAPDANNDVFTLLLLL
jgi:hypothetical protein